jgi:hypothetical protein
MSNEYKGWGKSGAQANLPQEPVMKNYPKASYSMDESIDDTIVRLDSDAADSAKKLKRSRSHRMN